MAPGRRRRERRAQQSSDPAQQSTQAWVYYTASSVQAQAQALSTMTTATPTHVLYAYPFTTTLTLSAPTGLPTLAALGDGSLVSPAYGASLRAAGGLIFAAALLGALFVRNTLAAASYIRRAQARDMTLFYLLLFSQIWGPVAVGALLTPLVIERVNCKAVNIIMTVTAQASFSVLISGILGLKAYRCLNRSTAVAAALVVTQVTSWVLTGLDLQNMDAPRTLAGMCSVPRDLNFLPTAFALSTIEALLFVAMCFAYAAYTASRRTAALARISLDASAAVPPPGEPTRGWWDYAPPATAGPDGETTAADEYEPVVHEKIGRGGKARSMSIKRPNFARMLQLGVAVRMELVNTTLILCCVVLTFVMVSVSTRYSPEMWAALVWLGALWGITSLLVMQSFGAVVARHEREALLRSASAPVWSAAPVRQTPWGRAVSFSDASFTSRAQLARGASVAGTLARKSVAPTVRTRAPTIAIADAASVVDLEKAPLAAEDPFADWEARVWRRGSASGIARTPTPASGSGSVMSHYPSSATALQSSTTQTSLRSPRRASPSEPDTESLASGARAPLAAFLAMRRAALPSAAASLRSGAESRYGRKGSADSGSLRSVLEEAAAVGVVRTREEEAEHEWRGGRG